MRDFIISIYELAEISQTTPFGWSVLCPIPTYVLIDLMNTGTDTSIAPCGPWPAY